MTTRPKKRRSGSARAAGSSTTPRSAIPTAASRPEPPSRTSPRTGSARSAAPAPPTSARSSRARPERRRQRLSPGREPVRLRLDRRRLRLRRVGLGAAPGRKGLLASRVLECGKRFRDEDFPKSTWDLRRYFWAPRLGMRGIFRLTLFKDVAVVSGCGVGGGSLGYANTLYVPARAVLRGPAVGATSTTGSATLAPHYDEAQRMLGVVVHDKDDPADQLLREFGEELGVGDTYRKTPIGVFLDEPGRDRPRPVLRRRGPGPHRLHAVRPLHGRLPARRQEHAGQELPLAGRAARRRGAARAHRDRHPPARRRRRQRRLRGHQRALRRCCAAASGAR